MRQIKFRAWDKINKQMIPHKLLSVLLKNIGNNNQFIYEQFTGLKDKNGTEIYEGDFVKSYPEPGSCGIVSFVDGCSTETRQVVWLERLAAFGWQLLNGVQNQSGFSLCKGCCDIFEVIGNIHQNPELLEDKQCQT